MTIISYLKSKYDNYSNYDKFFYDISYIYIYNLLKILRFKKYLFFSINFFEI